MKVTKEMLHEDLHAVYGKCNFMPRFIRFRWAVKLINFLMNKALIGKDIESLACDERYIPSSEDNTQIRVRIYRPKNHQGKLPLLIYYHGGGYIFGNPEQAAHSFKRFIKTRPCIIVAPDYRKSFTKPFPAGFNDCYDTLLWAKNNAESLGAYDNNIMIAGQSAGGGLTAAVTLKARDTGDANIAFQMPLYPMIDDTQPDDSARNIDTPVWNTTTNRLGWNSYLAELHKSGAEIPSYAAPIRNTDYRNFPPTITFVGKLEPFFWETEAYVKALREEGINVAYKLYDGCFHSFEEFAANSDIGKDAIAFTFDSYADFYDKYVAPQRESL